MRAGNTTLVPVGDAPLIFQGAACHGEVLDPSAGADVPSCEHRQVRTAQRRMFMLRPLVACRGGRLAAALLAGRFAVSMRALMGSPFSVVEHSCRYVAALGARPQRALGEFDGVGCVEVGIALELAERLVSGDGLHLRQVLLRAD